jgi:hypothetical protein
MDFCAVGSVKDYMKKSGQALTEKQVAAVLHSVCEGLSYLHQENIVHRYGGVWCWHCRVLRGFLIYICACWR